MSKLFLSSAALWILLTPALAQRVGQPSAEQPQQMDQPIAEQAQEIDHEQAQQPPSMETESAAQTESQPAVQPSGMTQAAAQLAAAQQAQADEEQNSVAPSAAEQLPQPPAQPEEQQQGPQASQQESQQPAQPEEQPQEAQQGPPPDTAPQSREPMQPDQPWDNTAQPSDSAQLPDVAPPSLRPPVQRRALEVPPAVRPRSEAAAYPVSRVLQQFSVGARLLSTKDVERKFSTPLGKHYLVVEVGLFPAGSQTIQLRPDNFTLRIVGDDQAFFPTTPGDIAAALTGSGSRSPRFYPGLGIGYGGWGRGVSTEVGVGGYPRRGGMVGGNRRVMETELTEKSLPAGSLTQPAAGYLYFPLSGKRSARFNLEFTRNGETVSLPLPAPGD